MFFVRPTSVAKRGTVFSVTLDAPDGEMIATDERDPEHYAARVLESRGLGARPLHVFAPSLTNDRRWVQTLRYRSVSGAAKLRTVETPLTGPRTGKFVPFSGVALKEAVAG